MNSFLCCLSRGVKYTLAAAVASLLISTCASLEDDQFGSKFQSDTGLIFPESVVDLACLANTFPSQFKQHQDEDSVCSRQLSNDYAEIKEIPGLIYDEVDQSFISNTYPSLGIKGLHLKVFERKVLGVSNDQYVFVVIRHQEHDSFLTDEMNEMMSLFGAAAMVDRDKGNKGIFGASTVSSLLRYVRQQFGLDYVRQALTMFERIQLHYHGRENIKFIFSGFSSGGLYSILLALYFHRPAITFAATGAEDIARLYYSDLFSKTSTPAPIFNFAHLLDPVPRLDCQIGTLCLFAPDSAEQLSDAELESLHISTIFGVSAPEIIEWLSQSNRWTCSAPDHYNGKYGSCQRERRRWKDKIKSNSLEQETDKRDL